MSDQSQPSQRIPGRRGKQGQTRARLIEVCIDLIRSEGLTALTTARIAREAGIAQPGFYAHFKNVDECMRIAVGQVVDQMRERQTANRRQMFELFQGTELVTPEVMRSIFETSVNITLQDPAFADLFLRYRRDPSPLGDMIREVWERVRHDFTEDMWRQAQRTGFQAEQYPLVAFWAEQVLGLYSVACEALLDGRFTDRDMVLDQVAFTTYTAMVGGMRGLGLLPPRAERP